MQNHGLAIKLGVQPTEKQYIKRFMQGHDPRYFIEGFGSDILQLHYTNYTALHYNYNYTTTQYHARLHNTTRHYAALHYINYTTPRLQLQLRLQIH